MRATDCDCEWCYHYSSYEAYRTEAFDGKSDPTPGDWMRAGIGHVCSRCGYEAHPDSGGQGIGDEAVCEECITLADWDAIDPEYAAELRANS